MIKSFGNKDTRKFAHGDFVKAFSAIERQAQRALLALDAATNLEDLRASKSFGLHKLSGDRKGQWAIRINDQYRVCFRFEEGDALDVEITDYH